MASLRRLRRVLASEEGSFLIEALVTAAILLTVSAGVMLALQTAHAESGLQRAKALATDVAQNKLDQIRSREYNDLRPLLYAPESDTVDEGGMRFTVVTQLSTVSQSGAPTGCNNQRARDYMSVKTTVTWAKMGKRRPVVLDTLVAAPVGAGGGLVATVTGGAGQGVPNIPLALKAGAGSATTDLSGCARWDAVSAGTGYALETSVDGYVQPNGQQNVSISPISIIAEETAQVSLAYDRGGSVNVRFQERLPGSTIATDVPASSLPPDVTLWSAAVTVTKPVAPVSGATGVSGLYYPYSSSYGIYADKCPTAKPADTAPASGRPSAVIPAGGNVAATLELPSLNLKVTNNGALPRTSDGITVSVLTPCGAKFTGRSVRTDGLLTNPGLPYATTLTVCASNAAGTMRGTRTISNTSYAAPGTSPTTLNLTANTSGNACPFS